MHQFATKFIHLTGQFLRPARVPRSVMVGRTEGIRHAMLDALGETDNERIAQAARKVRDASDVQGLWYLRSVVMDVLATEHGEALAQQQVEHLTAMFHGLLPNGLRPRVASPLRH